MIDSAQVGRRTRRHNVYLGRSFASSWTPSWYLSITWLNEIRSWPVRADQCSVITSIAYCRVIASPSAAVLTPTRPAITVWSATTMSVWLCSNSVFLHMQLLITFKNWNQANCPPNEDDTPQAREQFFGWGSKNWTSFRLGKQKLVKNNRDNKIQGTTLCNTGMYFSKKKYTQCTTGSRAKPQKLRNFRKFLC